MHEMNHGNYLDPNIENGAKTDFCIGVAGYPEKHPEAPDAQSDLANLKRKVDVGGQVVITQLFFDNRDFFAFRERCQQLGIQAPIVPGILPVTNLAQIQRISSMCGAALPQAFVDELGRKDDEQWQFEVGVDFAGRQVAGEGLVSLTRAFLNHPESFLRHL